MVKHASLFICSVGDELKRFIFSSQQVQCKLADGPAASSSRENVLPGPSGPSRRSSRDNNGISEDRMSVTSASSRGVRPDWANPSVSVVESVAVLQADLVKMISCLCLLMLPEHSLLSYLFGLGSML